ncbi:alpha/beta-hydrolase [Bimuria novae-zelandiae CBS 107.79]|uniref:Alpha/beta-hydrolase n=1 Tax=Bimuria novae-zelandiae CBS 107.79 TaxID=1447943 RepID=A0A6A5VLT1_9PLEO|nr:alpha/beta-hydrolase [Bimuria novae-zelandiae CBS 107.79]
MPSQSHGRCILFAVILSFALVLSLLRFGHGVGAGGVFFGRATTGSIGNETLGFEKIFVVNAPWRTDRKDAMTLAASYSRLKLDWIDGVAADTIQEKAYPPGNYRTMNPGNLGSWRAHMNAMRDIIFQNITTALILEDDVDWDIRLRTQLHSFAHAARQLPSLKRETLSHPPASETKDINPIDLAKRSTIALSPGGPHNTPSNPYGVDWDVLWLGHCGADLPRPSLTHPDRLMLLNDPTVPLPKHLRLRASAPPDPLATLYPPHTRVYHHNANSTLCTFAYAVTQRGARKILYELGIRELSKGFDFALGEYCGGLVKGNMGEKGMERRLKCVTVQPPLFSHFWGERGQSDIMGMGAGGRAEVGSRDTPTFTSFVDLCLFGVTWEESALGQAACTKFQLSPIFYVSTLSIAGCSLAQQFPPPVSYDTVLRSPINPSITISYKEPEPWTCKTAFPSQKQYTGYVNMPPSTLAPYQQDYPINTFFWFFEARNNSNTAPLTIWLNGGPGSSSMIGLFREMGPCEVVQLEDGSYETQANVWGWDRSSNLLFIDQPTQVGFSYDQPVNVSIDYLTDSIEDEPEELLFDYPPWGLLNGTLASGDSENTENSTVIAARAAWHFLQGFLSAFPQYNPGQHPDRSYVEATGVNLFVESYGGQYGPIFADFFEDQNDRRNSGVLSANNTFEIKLTSLGIINGLVDTLIQTPSLPSFAYKNSYDLQLMSQTQYLNYLSEFYMPDGCLDLGYRCHTRAIAHDYEGENLDEETTLLCGKAAEECWNVQLPVLYSGRNPYDIRATFPNSFPSYAYLEYLNRADVLQSIGAKVNFTESSSAVFDIFNSSGDEVRGTAVHKIADLLSRGVRVALIYGDADIICNWVGGEAVSLAIARESPLYSSSFPAAGYADIVSNASYIGGHVRQYSNLSFSRIFDSGHTVPSYQPETSFVVFSRIIEGDDIGMGQTVDLSTFGTHGPNDSVHKNISPSQPRSTCWIRAIRDTCTVEEQRQIHNGLGVVEHGQWFLRSASHETVNDTPKRSLASSTTTSATNSRPVTTSSIPLTGVFTATETPTSTSGASRVSFRVQSRYRRQVPIQVGSSLRNFGQVATGVKHGLIGGLAGVGGLLLLLTALATCCFGWRYHRSRKHDRKFLGGPRHRPSPLLVSDPAAPTTEQLQPKLSIVQRFAQRLPRSHEKPNTAPARYDIGRPEEPPALDRRFTRRLSPPMEPIPEAEKPPTPTSEPKSKTPDLNTGPGPAPLLEHSLASEPGTTETIRGFKNLALLWGSRLKGRIVSTEAHPLSHSSR